MALKPYDPLQFTLHFKGIQITGFADGEFITASRKEDAFSLVAGGQGDVARVQNRNVTGQIKFVLQKTADVNALLAAIRSSDEKNGDGVGTAQIQQLNGTAVVHSEDAFFAKSPDFKVSKDLPTVEWVLLCGHIDIDEGATPSL